MNYHNLSIWHIIFHLFFSFILILNSYWLVFCSSFSLKCSNNFSTTEVINNVCPWNCIFNFFNYKNFFRAVSCVSFNKNIFVLRDSYMITNFKFTAFIIIVLSLTSTGFPLIVLYYYIHSVYHLIYRYIHSFILMSCICRF